MDRRTLLTMTICLLIFVGWQKYYFEPRMAAQKAAAIQTSSQPQSQSTMNASAPSAQKAPEQKLENFPLELTTGTAKISNGPRVFSDWDLSAYKQIDLDFVSRETGELEVKFDKAEYNLGDARGSVSQIAGGYEWVHDDAKLRLSRKVTKSENSNYLKVVIDAQFKSAPPAYLFVTLNSRSALADKDPEIRDRQLIYFAGDGVERQALKESIDIKEEAKPLKWIGATNRYFLFTAVNDGSLQPKGLVQPNGAWAGAVSMVYPVAGNSISIPLKVYFGPKELDALRAVEPTLDHTVDFGWFTVFAYPLLRIMKMFFNLVKNWGVSIILLTLLVKLVTFPLTYKSMKSMKEMAKLQPQLQRLREKYKDDRETLNREMMNMMRTHGYNPAAGCFPILIQMPVFFALYRVLYSSIELYQAPFFAWIHDLSAKDPLYVTPILLTVTMFVQQKLTPNTAPDPAQQKMMQFMPVIFGLMMLSLPSGLTLYMLVNALSSIGQQFFLNRKLGTTRGTALAAR